MALGFRQALTQDASHGEAWRELQKLEADPGG